MKIFFKHCYLKLFNFSIIFICSSVWAGLPTPPDSDWAKDSSKDWIDVGNTLMNKSIKIVCVALGALILAGAAAGIIKAYHTAHEKQDLGHFFKMLIVGLIAAAVGLGLVYASYNIVSTQG